MFHSNMVFIARSKEEAESILEQFDQCGITWASGDHTTSFTHYTKSGTGYLVQHSNIHSRLVITYFTLVEGALPASIRSKIEKDSLEAPIEVSEWLGDCTQTIDTIEDLV